MSSSEMIEHIGVLCLHDDDPLTAAAMIETVNSLGSLPGVLFLTTVPILRYKTIPNNLRLTHIVHARLPSRSDLLSYLVHPVHVRTELMALPLLSELIVLDWAWPTLRPTPLLPGQALRFTCFKLKEGAQDKKQKILEGLAKIRGPAFEEMTYGEAITTKRAKGFTVAAVAVFADLSALDDSCEEYDGAMRSLIDQLNDAIDRIISVDYVIPRSAPIDTTNVQGGGQSP